MSSQYQPLITVVIPLYNKAATISSTLVSIVAQTYEKLEIIVVDDGSTDSSVSRVRQFNDSRLRLVKQRNRGQSAARNNGIELSQGEYVAFLDADDTWDVDHAEKLVDLILFYPQSGLYATAYRSIFQRNYVTETKALCNTVGKKLFLIEDYFSQAAAAPIVWIGAVCIPKIVLNELGGFIEGQHRGGDRELWARIALSHKIAYDSRVSVSYNCYVPGRESNRQRQLQWPPTLDLLKRELRKDNSKPDNIALIKYWNAILFSHIGKSLHSNNRGQMLYALNQVKIKGIYTIGRILWSVFLILLPNPFAKLFTRIVGSRYFLELRRPHYRRNGVSVDKLSYSSDHV